MRDQLVLFLNTMVNEIRPSTKVRESDIMYACELYDAAGVLRKIEFFVIVTVRKAFSAKESRVLLIRMDPVGGSTDFGASCEGEAPSGLPRFPEQAPEVRYPRGAVLRYGTVQGAIGEVGRMIITPREPFAAAGDPDADAGGAHMNYDRWASFLVVECLQEIKETPGEIRIFTLKHKSFPEANAARPDEYHLEGGVHSEPFCVKQCDLPETESDNEGAAGMAPQRGFMAQARAKTVQPRSKKTSQRRPRGTLDMPAEEGLEDDFLNELFCVVGASADDEAYKTMKEMIPGMGTTLPDDPRCDDDDDGNPNDENLDDEGDSDNEQDEDKTVISPLLSFTHLNDVWDDGVLARLGLHKKFGSWVCRDGTNERMGTMQWFGPGKQCLSVYCAVHGTKYHKKCGMVLQVDKAMEAVDPDRFKALAENVAIKWLAQGNHLEMADHVGYDKSPGLKGIAINIFQAAAQAFLAQRRGGSVPVV